MAYHLTRANVNAEPTRAELLSALAALVTEFDTYAEAMRAIGRGHEDYNRERLETHDLLLRERRARRYDRLIARGYDDNTAHAVLDGRRDEATIETAIASLNKGQR